MTLLPKDYYLIPDNSAKNLLSTATQELFTPWQQCQKLVKTIFHMYEKMELFFVFFLNDLFKICVCGLDQCKCTGRISNKSGYLSPDIVPIRKYDKSKD